MPCKLHASLQSFHCALSIDDCFCAGDLVARCDGPTHPANCQLIDNRDDTFTLDVIATESGRHVLAIECDGQHATGSQSPS